MHTTTLLLMMASATTPASALQERGPAPGRAPAVRACALLTKELIVKVTPQKNTSYLFLVPPIEDTVGAGGSACEYGDVGLQIDPFPVERFTEYTTRRGERWTPLPGIGDVAYFHENGREFAELLVGAGSRTFTIQMGVPNGSTPGAIKPNVIALAKEVLQKLK